jgi:hypothetical protein
MRKFNLTTAFKTFHAVFCGKDTSEVKLEKDTSEVKLGKDTSEVKLG